MSRTKVCLSQGKFKELASAIVAVTICGAVRLQGYNDVHTSPLHVKVATTTELPFFLSIREITVVGFIKNSNCMLSIKQPSTDTLRRRCQVARKMVLYCMCREGRINETTEGFGLVKHRPQGPTEGTPQTLHCKGK